MEGKRDKEQGTPPRLLRAVHGRIHRTQYFQRSRTDLDQDVRFALSQLSLSSDPRVPNLVAVSVTTTTSPTAARIPDLTRPITLVCLLSDSACYFRRRILRPRLPLPLPLSPLHCSAPFAPLPPITSHDEGHFRVVLRTHQTSTSLEQTAGLLLLVPSFVRVRVPVDPVHGFSCAPHHRQVATIDTIPQPAVIPGACLSSVV